MNTVEIYKQYAKTCSEIKVGDIITILGTRNGVDYNIGDKHVVAEIHNCAEWYGNVCCNCLSNGYCISIKGKLGNEGMCHCEIGDEQGREYINAGHIDKE